MSALIRPTTTSRLRFAWVIAPALCLFACSHDQPPAQAPMGDAPSAPTAKAPPQDNSLVVGASIRSKCNLPETRSDSPQFDFDEATLRPRGMGILDGIASCMRDGSLKGEGVTVIGHTDPRGSDEYNKELGMRRADASRDYLASKGVASNNITVKSRGKEDATGDTAAAWQLDRRVEIDESSSVPQ